MRCGSAARCHINRPRHLREKVSSDVCFFFSSRRRHTRCSRDWSSDVCSSDLLLTSGEELLAAYDPAEPPAALVLDQMMPGLTGLETAARLRADGFTQPIILCSGQIGRASCRERVHISVGARSLQNNGSSYSM